MKKNSILVKTVLMSMLTAATFTFGFTSCSNDDDLDTAPQMETDFTHDIASNVSPASQRVINFEGVDNARDMGGLVMRDGRTVCFDKLVRSGKLAKATDADVAILQNRFHLSDVFDFRFDLEMTEASDRVISGVTYTQVSTMPQTLIEAQAKLGAGSGQLSTAGVVDVLMKYAFDPEIQEMVKQLYPIIVTDPQSQANYGKFLHGVLAAKGGVLWHCSEGKDRCGWGSALLLAALGANRQVIVEDFDMSNQSYAEQVEALSAQVRDKKGGAAAVEFIQAMVGVSTKNFEATLDLIDQQYGSMEQYLENQLGFSKEEQNLLRAKYLSNVMVHNAEAATVAQPITGVWYAAYKACGTAVSDNNDGKSIDYTHAFDVYEFHEDGTGAFHRHFISEGNRTPELSWGKEGKGDFTYTSTADGQVKVTLRNGQELPYDRQWSMNYSEKDENIAATGAGNSNITLTPASESLKEVLDEWNDDMRHVTRYAAAAAGAGSINKPGIDIIDTYGLLVRFTGALLGKYGEGYICGMMVGDHRELVEIPEFLNCGLINAPLMYRIIGIDNWAFRGHNHIKRLTIAPSVLYIGIEAFKDCTGLVDVQLNPVELGDGAFMGCTALESVNISDASTLNKIGKDCFNGCTRLSSFQFPLTINVIGDRAFKGCSNLMSATFGMHLTTIGKEAFSGCSKLMSVNFPSQLEIIDDAAFRYCVKLVSIDIPIGIRKIGKKAFADCSKLSSVSPYQFEYHTEMATDAFEHTPMLHKPTVKK